MRLFLIRYGLVIVDEYRMYYKTLRSRVMFEKMLWNENKCLNQKFFYCEKNINKITFEKFLNNLSGVKTKKNILINDYLKNQLKNYLQEKKINIKYFENFEGYIKLIVFEGFLINSTQFAKGLYIYFCNSFYNKYKFAIIIKEEIDIDMILILLKFFFVEHKLSMSENDFFNIFIPETLNNNNFVFNFHIGSDLDHLINYLTKYKNFLYSIKIDYFLNENNNNNYISIISKQNINIEKFYKFNLCENKEFFLKFKGFVYLVEVEIIFDNKKLKRFVLFFFNLINNKIEYDIHFLFDKVYNEFVLNIFNFILIEDDKNIIINDELNYNLINLMQNYDIIKKYNDFKKEYDSIIISNNFIKILNINNLKNLLFILEHYNFFFSNND